MEIGLNKLFLFPDKLKGFLEIWNKKDVDNTFPVSVELSLTNRCNFNCIWCSDQKIRNNFKGDLDKNVLFKLLEELSKNGVKGICIEGGGEPTLYRDFREVVLKAKRCGLKIGLITNGSVFNYEDMFDNFEWVRVSLDVATKHQMKILKENNLFDQVISNIEKMCRIKKNTVVGIAYILSNKNIYNLENIIKKIKIAGADYFYIRQVIDHPELWPKKINIKRIENYNSDNFSVLLSAMKEHEVRGNYNLPCITHSLTTVITADGNVYLCGRLNQYDHWKPMGNIYKNNFNDIWTGKERKRQSLLVKNSKFCQKNCPECRLTKYNKIIHDLKLIKTKNFI
ncbi:radical SAM protein [Patescibacteria group bacterium]